MFACSDGAGSGYPFGSGSQPTGATQVTAGSATGDTAGSTADSSPTSGTTQAVDGPTGADPETTDGPVTSTTGAPIESSGSTTGTGDPTTGGTDGAGRTTDGTSGTTGDDGVGNPGVQPGAGMYSECTMFDACPPLVDPFCLSVGPAFGFCTVQCNASNECDPAPGDTTTAICDPTVGYCMLDCEGGACPVGLDCVVGDLGGGVVSRCLEQ